MDTKVMNDEGPVVRRRRWLRTVGDDGRTHIIHLPGTLFLGPRHAHALHTGCQCSPRIVRGIVKHRFFRAGDAVMGHEHNH